MATFYAICRRASAARLVAARQTIILGMSTLPLSEVKARLSEIADEVDRTHERVHVTRNGREYVVLLSEQELSSLEATIELLADPPAVERVRQAEADVAAGDVTSAAEMAELMRRRLERSASSDE
jgi:antitoxin YefM